MRRGTAGGGAGASAPAGRRPGVASRVVSGMVNAGVLVLALGLVVVAAILLIVRLGRLR